jgi:hypothetical protein
VGTNKLAGLWCGLLAVRQTEHKNLRSQSAENEASQSEHRGPESPEHPE